MSTLTRECWDIFVQLRQLLFISTNENDRVISCCMNRQNNLSALLLRNFKHMDPRVVFNAKPSKGGEDGCVF